MKIKQTSIQATAPTGYQYSSLMRLQLPITSHRNGSYSVYAVFDTVDEAREYLTNIAIGYYESEEETENAIATIDNYNYLRIDAITASIVEEELIMY